MAKLTTKQRNHLPKGSFAIPSDRAYLINDRSHARNALARVSQHGTPAEKQQVRHAVAKKYPGMGGSKAEMRRHEAHETAAQEKAESPAMERREKRMGIETSGIDRAMSAHADRMHPAKGRK